MRVSAEQLLPSQDFLKPRTVAFIFECIQKGELDQLPPNPIVREDKNGKLIAIDGHNLIAVKLHRGEEIDVHIATSADDGLPPISEANRQRDKDLKEKFDFVLTERTRLHDEGIDTFHDLISRYEDLFQG
jgi:hypothetical protein